MSQQLFRMLCAALLVLSLSATRADDTDIYTNRIVPPTTVPLVMFSIDLSSGLELPYAGCVNTGIGVTMCPAAKFFYDRCPSCRPLMPVATAPFRRYDAIRFALRTVMLENGGMKVGLMFSHDHQINCTGTSLLNTCSNGGYIARGFKAVDHVVVPFTSPVVTTPGPNLTEFLAIVDSLPVATGQPDHAYQGKELFFEFFRYMTGQDVYNGHNGWKDYGTNNTQNLNVDNPAIDWDASIEVPLLNRYISPLTADLTCSKIFTVNFLLNPSRQEDDSDPAIDTDTAGGMVGLDLPNGDKEFKKVVGYLQDVDLARDTLPFGSVAPIEGKQNVTSYFFAPPSPINSNPPKFDQASLSYARQGGTNRPLPLNEDPALLLQNLNGVISQILSVSTTFVAASVPVNVFNRSQTLESVYMALFQADASGKPFWPGNLKKLRLNTQSVSCAAGDPSCAGDYDIQLLDVLGNDAVASDGRIRNEALTFWTDGSVIAADPNKGVIAGKDGRHVDRGGAGQKIPGYLPGTPGLNNSVAGSRQLYTYPGSGSALVPLNADAGTAALLQPALGVASASVALNVLLCIRGFDCVDSDGDLNTSEVRPWLMGDPLHSRPLPINYGAISGHTQSNPAIYIAMGANDGFLYFFRNTTSAGVQSGTESWGFMPVESLAVQDRLAQNNVTSTRLYGVDGPPTSYVKDVDRDGNIESADGDRVYLYFGQRRGGRGYYALDVTNPALPVFLWQIKPTLTPSLSTSLACSTSLSAGTGLSINSACALQYSTLSCSGDYCELGYAFPQPRVGQIQYGVDSFGRPLTKPAVFFAGGYDTNKDYPSSVLTLLSGGLPSAGTVGTNDSKGNAIYVVDAVTGELIWKAVKGASTGPVGTAGKVFTHTELKDSIPSTLTIVDTDGNGAIDRIAVGDTGGNVWRADLGGDADNVTNPTLAQITDDWKLTLLAKLGRHSGSGKFNDRRFFHEPDYVLSRDEGGPFDAIVMGSGDREDPMDYGRERTLAGVETFTDNNLFVIKDRRTGTYAASDSDSSTILTPALLADVSSNCLQNGVTSSCNPDLNKGWRIRLTQTNGEKALASPLTAAHRIYFTTYLPKNLNDTTSCAPSEGRGLFYALNLKTGTAVFNYNIADGTAVGGGANTAEDRFERLTSSGIPTEAVYVNLATASGGEAKCVLSADLRCREVPGATRFRTFWRRVE